MEKGQCAQPQRAEQIAKEWGDTAPHPEILTKSTSKVQDTDTESETGRTIKLKD